VRYRDIASALSRSHRGRRGRLGGRGHAVAAAYRLLAALREFGADDRAAVLELLALELAETVA
jgi:hypothetical protein